MKTKHLSLIGPIFLLLCFSLLALKAFRYTLSPVWMVSLFLTALIGAGISYLAYKELEAQLLFFKEKESEDLKEKEFLKAKNRDLFALKMRIEEEALSQLEKEPDQTSLHEALDQLREQRQKNFLLEQKSDEEELFTLDWFRLETMALLREEKEASEEAIDLLTRYLNIAASQAERQDEEILQLEELINVVQDSTT